MHYFPKLSLSLFLKMTYVTIITKKVIFMKDATVNLLIMVIVLTMIACRTPDDEIANTPSSENSNATTSVFTLPIHELRKG